MRKNNEVFPSYTLFNSFPNKNVSPFNKFMMIIFFIYILITFSDEGLINALSEQIISDYNISPEKYSLIKIISSLGQISCSIVLLKLIKKIIHHYKLVCIFFFNNKISNINIILLSLFFFHISFNSLFFKFYPFIRIFLFLNMVCTTIKKANIWNVWSIINIIFYSIR